MNFKLAYAPSLERWAMSVELPRRQTTTGGRNATGGWIPGDVALSVGKPDLDPPPGYQWRLLTEVARLETGHTPSRRVPEYWGGEIPWIGIRDATANHGRAIYSTNETITEDGERNSSTRLLPQETVCLSRTASVGYVVTMGVPMCTSQDFVNWVCGPDLDYRYLKYILLAERNAFLRFATGTTHQTVYFPEVKAFNVLIPSIREQTAIADVLGALDDKIESNRRSQALTAEYADACWRKLIEEGNCTKIELESLVKFNAHTVKPGHPDERIAYIDISSVKHDKIEEVRWMTWREAPSRARRSVVDGDMIFSTVRPDRRSFALVVSPEPYTVVSTGFATLSPTEIGPAFLHAILSDQAFSDHCSASAQGTAYPVVNPEAMGEYSVLVPDSIRLQRFEDEVMPMLRLSHALAAESETLERLRNVALPELLSGRSPAASTFASAS